MIRQIAEALKVRDRILIASHINPEADAIGSSMALGMGLDKMSKSICIYNASGAPRNLTSFPRVERVSTKLPPWKPDALVVLDCGELDRIGAPAAEVLRGTPMIINVDHHATNDGFGHLNWVEPESSSTAELVTRLLEAMGVEIIPDMATWILAAIVADTGRFQFSNATPEAFYTAGKMVNLGARPEMIAKGLFGNLPVENLKLLAMVLATLEVDPRRELAMMRVTADMFRETGTGPDAVEGFVEYPRALEGVEIAALFRETDSGAHKVSLRSNGAMDVGALAHIFGGGGHKQAAGYTVEGDFEHVKRKLVEVLDNADGGR